MKSLPFICKAAQTHPPTHTHNTRIVRYSDAKSDLEQMDEGGLRLEMELLTFP